MLMVPISGTNLGTNVGTNVETNVQVVKKMSNVKLSNTWTMEEVHTQKKLT